MRKEVIEVKREFQLRNICQSYPKNKRGSSTGNVFILIFLFYIFYIYKRRTFTGNGFFSQTKSVSEELLTPLKISELSAVLTRNIWNAPMRIIL